MAITDVEWAPRLRLAFVVVVALLVVPLLVGWALGGTSGAFGVVIGASMVAVSASAAGLPAARLAAPALVAAIVLGSLTTGGWPWVAVVAGFSVLAGLASALDATGPFVLAALVATIAPEPPDVGAAVWLGVFTAIGCTYGLALARRTGVADHAQPLESTLPPAVLAVALGAIGGGTAAIALVIDDETAYWIPMTALILAVPAASGATARGRERVIGTLIGAAFAIAIGVLAPPRFAYGVISVVALFMIVATAGLAYRVQSAFITVLTLLAGGRPRQEVVARRVAFTVAGAGLLIAGIVVVTALTRRGTDAAD